MLPTTAAAACGIESILHTPCRVQPSARARWQNRLVTVEAIAEQVSEELVRGVLA